MTIRLISSTDSSHWRAVFTLGLIFLMSCKGSFTSSDVYISKEEAIDAALENAMMTQPEISGPQEKPSNINAEQMTLAEAVKKINEQNEPAAGYDSNMMVWFVSMDGIWLDEFPRPADFPTPAPYRHYVVIVDAKTAQTIESAAFP
jgi:hypothetical protein